MWPLRRSRTGDGKQDTLLARKQVTNLDLITGSALEELDVGKLVTNLYNSPQPEP
jgi:hypothetical protein